MIVIIWWICMTCTILESSVTSAINLPNTTYLPTDFSPDSIRTIIEGLGFKYESYEVVTEDGYILNLNRMINPDLRNTTDKGVPILLVNGLFAHSDSWFLQVDPKFIAPVHWLLAGYDVWLGDQRGTVRSVKHKYWSTWSWKFWDFSFHETGYYDIPAWIDFILQKTGHEKLAYSGLSDGGAAYYVMTTMRPEYQDKLYGGVLWSPVGQSPSLWSIPLLTQLTIRIAYFFLHILWDFGPWPYLSELIVEEIPPMTQVVRKVMYYGCKLTPDPLIKFFLNVLFGEGCQVAEQDICLQIANGLGGTSAKTILHTIQLFQDGGKFQMYDYGSTGNLYYYGKLTPPEYDISKLEVFTALYYSNTDHFAPTNTVVPFAHKFSGPAYECQVDNVCHVYVLFDSRVWPFLEDATDILGAMTGRAAKNSASQLFENSKLNHHISKCNVSLETATFAVTVKQ